nr:MAG TPA: Putative head tail adaptor [Caudoviricetes sp.]
MPEAFVFKAAFSPPLEFADFDKKELKKGLGEIGSQVRKIARKLVSRRAVSRAFENPGKVTGALQASITAKASKSGFSTVVASRDNAGFRKKTDGDFFYPYALYYGHVGPKRGLKRDGNRVHKRNTTTEKVAQPRNNFIVQAAEMFGRTKYEGAVLKILDQAIKPGPIGGLAT